MPDSAFAVLLRSTDLPTDAWAAHAYSYPLAPRVKQLRRWFPKDAEVWITEVGLERKVIPGEPDDWEQIQAKELREAVEAGHGYDRVYLYQKSTEEPLETHGVIRPDGSLRPAAEWLKNR